MLAVPATRNVVASRLIADYRVWRVQPPKQRSPLVDSEQVVQFAEDWLGKHPWFGGAEFSAADIMMKFPLDFGIGLNVGLTRSQLEQILSIVEASVGKKEADAGRKVLSSID